MKKTFTGLTLLFLFAWISFVNGQIVKPVKWSFSSERISEKEATLILTATIDKGWHLYSQNIPENGPVPTSFKFSKGSFELLGKVSEGRGHEVFDPNFNMQLSFFSGTALFKQKIKLNNKGPLNVSGSVEFMACDDSHCIPPDEATFNIPVKPFEGLKAATVIQPNVTPIDSHLKEPAPEVIIKPMPPGKADEMDYHQGPLKDTDSLWHIFIAGFLGGLVALLTPCVFPMIPLTVSFFTKQGKNKSRAIANASLYGISIIVIYVTLGFGVTKLLGGADALNALASNGIFNMVFFFMLIIFGVSFLGAFEIRLPSSWINKADARSDKGGIAGIFFMAFTLALVSFSCTGPIIGTLLVQATHSNNYLGPLAGMTGFSLALALPFALFAAFPSWMQTLPRSGGWLNSVKVVLGFLELAFSLKFLSNVDLAYHWHLLNRDIFLVLWIVIFGMLGLYLLGKLKFSHDSDLKFVGLPRFFIALFSFGFALYMVPGLWGAPLKEISAFLPPHSHQDFVLGNSRVKINTDTPLKKKNDDLFECPLDLNCFFDFDEGMAYAKKTGKPVMLDFTGHTCTNCRKMEASVWADPKVLKLLSENYVLISLYVDDKTKLPEKEQFPSAHGDKTINTIGKKWSELQITRFNVNSQPYYVLLGHDEKPLVKPQGYNMDIDNYVSFLTNGISEFKKLSNK